MKKTALFLPIVVFCAASPGVAQQSPGPKEDGLDPTEVNAATDPNIDLFLNHWKNSQPRPMYGKLIFRDILTRLEGADPQHPARKGAVLTNITAVSYASLDPGAVAAGRSHAG